MPAAKAKPTPEAQGMTVVEEPDLQRDALQRAMLEDHQRRANPSQWVGLPNGRAVRAVSHVGMQYPGEKVTDMLGRPAEMLIDPKPDYAEGPRYQWRVRMSTSAMDNRPAETQMYHRSGRIRYVEVNEIDPESSIAVYTPYQTANYEYVTYQTLILCEILDPKLAYQQYKGWEDWALARTANLEDTTRGESDTHYGNKTNIDVDGPKDARRGG